MINLIPPESKKGIKREYRLRVAAVCLILIAFAFAMQIALKVPVYILIQSQINAYTHAFSEAEARGTDVGNAVKDIEKANATAKFLTSAGRPHLYSSIVESMDSLRGNAIAIEQYSFSEKDGGVVIQVVGVALDRQTLVGFRDGLSALPVVENVDLPFSNLASERDIQFTIDITLKKET